VLVKISKGKHDNWTGNLAFHKTCEVSLYTFLFIERTNNTEDNRLILYKIVFSTDSLLIVYDQIKFRPEILTPGGGKETSNNINLGWFKGLYVYSKM
jgi:hypothetical protein